MGVFWDDEWDEREANPCGDLGRGPVEGGGGGGGGTPFPLWPCTTIFRGSEGTECDQGTLQPGNPAVGQNQQQLW